MRKIAILSIAAVAFAGTTAVLAQAPGAPPAAQRERPAPPTTRADAQQRAAEMFARMDGNSDGKIDQADREAREKAMFDRIDTNRDGAVSFSEFTTHHQQRADARDDGPREGGKGPRAGKRGRGGHGMMGHEGPMMDGADANKDGALTQAEFTAAALARFDKADANKDGTISTDERRAGRAQPMRGQPRQRQDS